MPDNINDFSQPQKLLAILTSTDTDYEKLVNLANRLCEKIENIHTNKDDKKFHSISQCILECYKIINNFQSVKWISEKKLHFELKPGQEFITFTRINAKGEECLYRIANFDQIDFNKEIEYADEFEIIQSSPTASSAELNNASKPAQTNDNNDTLKKITDFIRNGDNIFITGHAGTGKSYILQKLKEKYKKQLTITSTTGIAAVNVKGQTLHSWAGVGLCRNTIEAVVEKIKSRQSQYRQILKCKILAIDEVSMLNPETFEYVDAVLKQIRENNKPFGGIQLILIGDFFQLPPVEKENREEKRYCFDSPLWEELQLKNVILKKNYRQSDEKFIKALSDMRINELTEDDIDLLSTRNTDDDTSDSNILHIFSTNEEANSYNLLKFNSIDRQAKAFFAKDGVYRGKDLVYEDLTDREKATLEIFDKNCRAGKEIILKPGCRVMLLVNMDFDKGLINGSCGTIEEFNDKTINITFDNGVNSNIPLHEFEYYYNDAPVAVRLQYPLKLAYGITIHKSQGMTLEKLVVDCKRIFERGQIYVAMSRVKTLEGLYLKFFDPDKVLVDNKVAEFYKNLEDSPVPEGYLTPDPSPKIGEGRTQNPTDYRDYRIQDEGQTSETEIIDIVLEFLKEFDGLYGKSGISKILTGSKTVQESEYNQKIFQSGFYNCVKNRTRKSVDKIIDKMTEDGLLTVKRISFGRPVLSVKK